jgi:hypothetical protein
MIKDIYDWGVFVKDFVSNILPIYNNHESSFDYNGIHGRMHVSRALIFAETMARYYYKLFGVKDIDFLAIRYAISFHDSGRKGNGIDIWESESADICRVHLLNRGLSKEYSKYVSQLIEKKGRWDAHKKMVHDADVLEIMRPCCGHGGRNGFKEKALRFLSNRDELINDHIENYSSIRKAIIDEAWQLIIATENKKHLFGTCDHSFFGNLIEFLYDDGNSFHFIKGVLKD